MVDSSKILPLIDRDMTSPGFPANTLYPAMEYQVTALCLGNERQWMDLLTGMIRKRKHISEITVKKLDDLILYCDNKVLSIGDEIKLKRGLHKKFSTLNECSHVLLIVTYLFLILFSCCI